MGKRYRKRKRKSLNINKSLAGKTKFVDYHGESIKQIPDTTMGENEYNPVDSIMKDLNKLENL